MKTNRLRDTYEDDIDQIMFENLPDDACTYIKKFVEASPKMEAYLRHIATLPSWEQRHRVLLTYQQKLRVMKFSSTFFPSDAMWYISNILPTKPVTKHVIWCQKWILPQHGLTVFSYTDKDGLLARYFFAFVVNEEGGTPDFLTAFNYKLLVTDHGGAAAVTTSPETRWNTINVVIGKPNWKWARYFVDLYSIDLIQNSLENKKFSPTGIEKFKIKQTFPMPLDIMYISNLAM